jgi:hypothetical protein
MPDYRSIYSLQYFPLEQPAKYPQQPVPAYPQTKVSGLQYQGMPETNYPDLLALLQVA